MRCKVYQFQRVAIKVLTAKSYVQIQVGQIAVHPLLTAVLLSAIARSVSKTVTDVCQETKVIANMDNL